MQPNSHILPHPSSKPLYTNVQLSSIPQQTSSLTNPQQEQQHLTSHYTNDVDFRTSKRPKVRKPRACDLCRRKKIRCDYDPHSLRNSVLPVEGTKSRVILPRPPKKEDLPRVMSKAWKTDYNYINSNSDETPMISTSSSDVSTQHLSPPPSSSSPSSNQHIISSPRSPNSSASPPQSTSSSSNAAIKRLHCVDKTLSHDAQIQEQLENAREGKYAYLGSSSGVYMLNRLFPKNTNDNDCMDDEHSRAMLQGKEDDVMMARFGHKSSHLNVGPGANDDATSSSGSASLWILPPKPVVDRLVDLYFKKMNLFLPIVDEDEFMELYRKDSDGISKPLLMTICRVTIRMLPADDPVVQQYQLDRTAVFWDMVRQLDTNYELDFMEPQIECIQMLLLSSANADRWSPKSANWLATSIAVKMAQDLGLHRSNSQWTLPSKSAEARKRLWWSAYIIDRWVCASLGRPLAVNDADCDLEYPESGDDGKYTAFVSIIKLSGVLGDVLRAICSPRARKLGGQGLGPERLAKRLKQALTDWKHGLPSSLWLDDNEMNCIHQQKVSKELESKINNGAGQLRVLYIAVQLLSKRPSIFLGPDHSPSSSSSSTSSSLSSSSVSTASTVVVPQECLDAVVDVLDIFYIIKFHSLMYVGWSLSSYGLSQVLMFIFLNHRNENEQVAAEAKRQAESFKQHYRMLEDHFVETSLITFLDAISKMIQHDKETEQKEACCKEQNGQTSSLWGTSSGMDWHDMMNLIGK
ncbi:unnamed protein product [Absidia cylindrospora]